MKRLVIFLLCGILAVGGTRIYAKQQKEAVLSAEEESDEATLHPEKTEDSMTAMVVTLGNGELLFVDQNTETPFYVTNPDKVKVTDEAGQISDFYDLKTGNLVEIIGNGVMANSYPGQYPGVTDMKVIQIGTEADADRYSELAETLYSKPDPGEIPFANVSFKTEDMNITMALTVGGYEWTYTDKDGNSITENADSAHITEWTDIIDTKLNKMTEAEITFSQLPCSVVVTRFAEGSTEEEMVGEYEESNLKKMDQFTISAEPGYRYLIAADYENGHVEYGFETVDEQKK